MVRYNVYKERGCLVSKNNVRRNKLQNHLQMNLHKKSIFIHKITTLKSQFLWPSDEIYLKFKMRKEIFKF